MDGLGGCGRLTEKRVALSDFLRAWPLVHAELRKQFVVNSCISTSRILALMLEEWHLPGRICPVELHLANPAAGQRIAQGEPVRHRHEGAYFLTLGEPWLARPGGWPGHLVVVSGTTLIDPTIDQANRPDWNLNFTAPWVQEVGAEFWPPLGRAEAAAPDGTRLRYIHHPENRSYLRTPAWGRALDLTPVARRVLRDALRDPSP